MGDLNALDSRKLEITAARSALAGAGCGAIDDTMAGQIVYKLDGAGWALVPVSHISELEAERDRLRDALQDIADGMGETSVADIGRFAPAVARAALAASEATHD